MRKSSHDKRGRDYALAFLSGILLTGAFPKIGWSPLAWAALVPLLWVMESGSPSRGFKVGFLTGAVHYTTLLYWITNVMGVYGGLSPIVSWAILLVLAGYLSLYLAAYCWGVTVLIRQRRRLVWVAPFLWVTLEYFRAFLLTGFPWENLGYSQYEWLQVIQISDMFGVYGVSAVIVAINVCLFQCLDTVLRKKGIPWVSLLVAGLILGGTLSYGTWRIKEIDRTVAKAPKYPVTVVQGNIDQSQKWLPAFQRETLKRYGRLTRTVVHDLPTLTIWPETALPFYFFRDDVLTNQVLELVRDTKNYFVLGSPFVETKDGKVRYFNSAYLVGPLGNLLGRYDKVHLVPYGEYIPLRRFFPFLGKIVQAVGDFETGRQGRALSWEGNKLGVLICFEVIFPELARAMASSGAQVLVNITNDAWFGRTSAPHQHLSMAVFRAVETRRALARAANTGISAFIDPVGRFLDKTPLFEEAVRTRSLPLLDRETFYTRNGELFAWVGVCVSVLFLVPVLCTRTGVVRRRFSKKD